VFGGVRRLRTRDLGAGTADAALLGAAAPPKLLAAALELYCCSVTFEESARYTTTANPNFHPQPHSSTHDIITLTLGGRFILALSFAHREHYHH